MPRKRTGRVELRGDKYIARIGREYLGSFTSDPEAREAIAASLFCDANADDKRSFAVLGEAYMAEQEKLTRLRRGHAHWFLKSDLPIWKRYVRTAPFYRKRVDRITRDEIKALIDRVVGSPAMRWDERTQSHVPTGRTIGKNTGEKLRGRLAHFFKHCPGINVNPARDLPIKNVTVIKRRVDGDNKPHLHLDEIAALFALPLDVFTPLFRAVYACGIYGGLRGGEIVGLEWQHIVRLYGKQPEIQIRNSYASLTKTQCSQRELPALPQLVAELRAYRESLPAAPLNGYVFPGPNGGVRCFGWDADWYDHRGGTYNHFYPGFRTQAKIRGHIQYRHIRHTCATHLLKGHFTNGHEWPDEKIAQLLGHEDVRITREHYLSRDVDRLHSELAKTPSKKPRNE
jgi:integrase